MSTIREIFPAREDGFEMAAMPACTGCGTVLRHVAHGYWCALCRVVVIGV